MLSHRSPLLTALFAGLIVGAGYPFVDLVLACRADFRGLRLGQGFFFVNSRRQCGGVGRRSDSAALRGAGMAASPLVTRQFGRRIGQLAIHRRSVCVLHFTDGTNSRSSNSPAGSTIGV